LGFAVLSSLDLRDIARPYLEELSRITKQTVNLGILDNTEVVYIERVKKRRVVSSDFHIGSRLNIYLSSMGRAILAFMDHEEFNVLLNDILKNGQAVKYIGQNGERLMEIIEDVRHKGYAINDQEYFRGLRAAAAPVLNKKGMAEAAINMPVFSNMITRKELVEKYVPLLVKTAEDISMARGYSKDRTDIGALNKQGASR